MTEVFKQTAVISLRGLWERHLNLKAAAVFYDDVVIVDQQSAKLEARIASIVGQDFDFLQQAGIVSVHGVDVYGESPPSADEDIVALRSSVQRALSQVHFADRQYERLVGMAGSSMARLVAAELSLKNPARDYVPIILHFEDEMLRRPNEASIGGTAPAHDMIFKTLPTPSGQTPWEAILDYRADPDMWSMCYQLRKWINMNSREKNEWSIAESLRYEYDQLEKKMKIHDLQVTYTKFSATFSFLDTLHNILFLKFGELLRPILEIRKASIEVMELERRMRSEPLYMLAHAKRHFGQ